MRLQLQVPHIFLFLIVRAAAIIVQVAYRRTTELEIECWHVHRQFTHVYFLSCNLTGETSREPEEPRRVRSRSTHVAGAQMTLAPTKRETGTTWPRAGHYRNAGVYNCVADRPVAVHGERRAIDASCPLNY